MGSNTSALEEKGWRSALTACEVTALSGSQPRGPHALVRGRQFSRRPGLREGFRDGSGALRLL